MNPGDPNIDIREDGVARARPDNHRGSGGAIPASSLFFHAGNTDDAASLVKRYHYSRRMPSSIQFVGGFYLSGGLFGTRGECVASVIFSIPGTRWGEPVYELSRLVRKDDVRVPLTKLISLAVSRLRAEGLTDLLVSFADWTQRHVGTIYQAAGWHYAGKRGVRMDGLTVDGEFVPGRSCNSRWGTQSPARLAERFPSMKIEPHWDEGKHLYWKAIRPSGDLKAQRLELKREPYPKSEAA